jgi:branched-chain amino acid aminotransferase
MKAWLAGELVDASDAVVPITDKGLLLGDGVFETLRTYDGKAFALDEHLARLEHSASVLGIGLPSMAVMKRAVEQVLDANSLADARVRVTVTAGAGPVGLARGAAESPTTIVTATPLREVPQTARAIVSPWPRNERSVLTGVKSTSNAENVVKLAHARAQGVDEAISLNLAGNVCEGTSSNVFVVHADRVATPPLSAGCLAGITRGHVIDLAASAGAAIEERDISLDDLRTADELFLTSSTREVQPLVELDGQPVAGGGAGRTTLELADRYSAMTNEG